MKYGYATHSLAFFAITAINGIINNIMENGEREEEKSFIE